LTTNVDSRAQSLVFLVAHTALHVIEERRAEDEALFRQRAGAAVDPQLGAFLHSRLDIAGDLVAMLAGDQGAHVDALRIAAADLDRLCFLREELDQRISR